jgi:hypothetical protein
MRIGMALTLSSAWRLAFAAALVGAILCSAFARAPRQSVPPAELRRLVLCALGLYAVGGVASLTHHQVLAGLVYGAGIIVAALAAWLSRGRDREDPPDDGEPDDELPPPEPDGVPRLDWAAFERDFRAYASRGGERPKSGSQRPRDPSPS